ncbi:hypothetical protein BCR44DRAFT_79769 [Catenaria anguillulae PL171]|uniref:(+)RNA virus helicase C-terminal domain-containing protein n=1 Tax=Catenaria anguillulae PL171 TaxID=765915 RepID=A0A1Y2HVE7_9FUNG|nr:hypothetical protein BCR44DRAFT_79769 [Catenaria anguillulae PL171]
MTSNVAIVNASIMQYPIVPACAMTCHGVQGKTLSSILIADTRPSEVTVSPQAFYVALSRVRTSAGVALAGAPTMADFEAFVPKENSLNENNRVKGLSESTIARMKRQAKTGMDLLTVVIIMLLFTFTFIDNMKGIFLPLFRYLLSN